MPDELRELAPTSGGIEDKIHPKIAAWCYKQGWTRLRPVQELALAALDPYAESFPDAVISASTASGKTEAAFLPVLSKIAQDPEAPGIQILYIAPIKALINDQVPRIENMGAELELKAYPWHGDAAAGGKNEIIRKPSGCLLITPESLEAMLMKRARDIKRLFGNLQAIIIDELHAFIDNPRGRQLQSILHRIDLLCGREPCRLGLSATLSDMTLAADFARPGGAAKTAIISAPAEKRDLQMVLKAEVDGDTKKGEPGALDLIAQDAYKRLRGNRNLFFATARNVVEAVTDALTQMCKQDGVPNEFFAHHGNLSRHHRAEVEERMRKGEFPQTTVCTSTLEMGIDIGWIDVVGQVGVPSSVSGIVQRLGRSGRRAGQPAKLRMWIPLPLTTKSSHPLDHLRLPLIRAIAMSELLLEKWIEPPRVGSIDLSTLLHQIIALVCERHGITAALAYQTLCVTGPFRECTREMFVELLRSMGQKKLLEQSVDGDLLIGENAEKLIADRSFYSVFKTPLDWNVLHDGKHIGMIPVDLQMMAPGLAIILAGKRWKITYIDDVKREVAVKPSRSGKAPRFVSEPGTIHRTIAKKMREILESIESYPYLNDKASAELANARDSYETIVRHTRAATSHNYLTPAPDGIQLVPWDGGTLIIHWDGTIEANTLALRLMRECEFDVDATQHAIQVENAKPREVHAELTRIAEGRDLLPATELVKSAGDLIRGKFDDWIHPDLLMKAYIRNRIDETWLPKVMPYVKADEEVELWGPPDEGDEI